MSCCGLCERRDALCEAMRLLKAGATVAEVQANVSRQFADIASLTPLQEVGVLVGMAMPCRDDRDHWHVWGQD